MKRFLVAASLAFSVCCAAFADNNIGDVLKQIAQNNLTLRALAHDNNADVLDIKAENTLAGPSVEYSPFFRSGVSGVAQSELVVSQEMQFPTKYAMRSKQARMQQTVGDQLAARQRRDILLEAELLCIDIIRFNKTLVMLNERFSNSDTLRLMYEKRMAAGDANILELNKVKLDCMEVLSLVKEAQNERAVLLQQLVQLNGGKAIEILTTEMPSFAPINDFDTYRSLALATDADVKAAEAVLRSAELNVKAEKQEWLPNISVGYRRNTEQHEAVNGMLVGVSFPLYSNRKGVKAAQERRQSAELQVMQAQQQATSSLRSRYQQLVGLQQILDNNDVKMMQETIALFAKALQQGEITALVYYEEINNIYEKLQRHIDLQCQSVKIQAELHKNEL